MERKQVVSSNIISVGYDKESLILEIEFKGNTVYQYTDVDERTYEELIAANSVGKYFHQNIRNEFSFTKV